MIPFSWKNLFGFSIFLALAAAVALSGCKGKGEGDGAPTQPKVITVADMNLVTIDPNDVGKFPITSAGQNDTCPRP